jgi:hypothetical protein
MPNFPFSNSTKSFSVFFYLFLLATSHAPSHATLFHIIVSSLVTSLYKSIICSSDSTVGSNIIFSSVVVNPTGLKVVNVLVFVFLSFLYIIFFFMLNFSFPGMFYFPTSLPLSGSLFSRFLSLCCYGSSCVWVSFSFLSFPWSYGFVGSIFSVCTGRSTGLCEDFPMEDILGD